MGVSRRKIWAIGVSLAGFIYMVAPSNGQGQGQGQAPKADARVQAANGATAGNRAASALKAATPTIVGTIDLDYVFKNYDKVKAANKELGAAIQIRKGELMKYDDEARSVYEMMKKLNPGSDDYHKHENRLTELKAKMEAGKESAEREITLRQAETMATLYKEVQAYAKWVAQKRGISHVMLTSNAPPSGSDPNSVMAAISRPVMYADPGNDITNDVVYYLNSSYQKLGKQTVEKPAARHPQAAGATSAGDP
jgi:Skp family chaperone for outer membrane proteins